MELKSSGHDVVVTIPPASAPVSVVSARQSSAGGANSQYELQKVENPFEDGVATYLVRLATIDQLLTKRAAYVIGMIWLPTTIIQVALLVFLGISIEVIDTAPLPLESKAIRALSLLVFCVQLFGKYLGKIFNLQTWILVRSMRYANWSIGKYLLLTFIVFTDVTVTIFVSAIGGMLIRNGVDNITVILNAVAIAFILEIGLNVSLMASNWMVINLYDIEIPKWAVPGEGEKVSPLFSDSDLVPVKIDGAKEHTYGSMNGKFAFYAANYTYGAGLSLWIVPILYSWVLYSSPTPTDLFNNQIFVQGVVTQIWAQLAVAFPIIVILTKCKPKWREPYQPPPPKKCCR
jgi:hypothetical protein